MRRKLWIGFLLVGLVANACTVLFSATEGDYAKSLLFLIFAVFCAAELSKTLSEKNS